MWFKYGLKAQKLQKLLPLQVGCSKGTKRFYVRGYKQSPLSLLGTLPWSYLQSLSLSQVHRQVHQKKYHDDIL